MLDIASTDLEAERIPFPARIGLLTGIGLVGVVVGLLAHYWYAIFHDPVSAASLARVCLDTHALARYHARMQPGH